MNREIINGDHYKEVVYVPLWAKRFGRHEIDHPLRLAASLDILVPTYIRPGALTVMLPAKTKRGR